MKKRRLDNEEGTATAVAPAASSCREVELPADCWAKVLGYLDFDDVLTCTAINPFFRNDVTQQMRYLCVRSGKSMNVSPALVQRFKRVDGVTIYLLKEYEDDDGEEKFHLDCDALKHAAPFLTGLPMLQWCFVGGDVERYLIYDVTRESDYDQPNANGKYASFIQSICKAYRQGKLFADIEVEGLIPIAHDVDSSRCPWKDIAPLRCHRSDVDCQMCDLIATSLPPLQMLTLANDQLPCIGFEDRVRIAQFRDEDKLKANLTEALLTSMSKYGSHKPVLCPPTFSTIGHSLCYDEWLYEMMKIYISYGADVNDPKVTTFFREVDSMPEPEPDAAFIGSKRVLTLGVFNQLTEAGFNIHKNNFVIADESDRRLKQVPPEVARVQAMLKSGTPIREVEEIRQHVEEIVADYNGLVSFSLDVDDVYQMLEIWLRYDLSTQGDEVKAIVAEYL